MTDNIESGRLPKKAASNTEAALRELIGGRVIGVLCDALPMGTPSLAMGTKTLIMHDGSGITFSPRGSYWRESPENIKRAIQETKSRLEDIQLAYKHVLALAGDISGSENE